MSLIRFYIGKNGWHLSCGLFMRFLKPLTIFKKCQLRRYYQKKSLKTYEFGHLFPKKDTKVIVALFLQYQPEASTMPKGAEFYDQGRLVEFLGRLENIHLIVREHPNQFSTAYARQPETYRTKKFYADNVIWHSHEESPFDLFSMADVVVSVGGNVLLEASLRGKLAISLGDNFFSHLSGIIRLHDYDSLKEILNNLSKYAPAELEQTLSELDHLDCCTIKAVVGGESNLRQIGLSVHENSENLQRSFEVFFETKS